MDFAWLAGNEFVTVKSSEGLGVIASQIVVKANLAVNGRLSSS